jgi:hypothetical protein
MNEWILIEDREPTVEEIRDRNEFICTDGMTTYIRTYSFRLHGFVTDFRGKESKDRGVIAWMPLPAPYKDPSAPAEESSSSSTASTSDRDKNEDNESSLNRDADNDKEGKEGYIAVTDEKGTKKYYEVIESLPKNDYDFETKATKKKK